MAHQVLVWTWTAVELAGIPPDKEAAEKFPDRYGDRRTLSSRTAKDVPQDLAFLRGLRRRIRLASDEPQRLMVADPRVNGPRGLAIAGIVLCSLAIVLNLAYLAFVWLAWLNH